MSSSSSTHVRDDNVKATRYSSSGGSRTRGVGDSRVGNPEGNTPSSPSTSPHLGVQAGKKWDYVVGDGLFERALAHDQLRLQELRRQELKRKAGKADTPGRVRPAKEETKPPSKDPKSKGLSIFRKRATSVTTLDSQGGSSSMSGFSLSSFSIRDSEDNYTESGMYEESITSSDDAGSIALSSFRAPTFLLADEDGASLNSASTHSFATTAGKSPTRSHSSSSHTMDPP